LPTEKDFDPWGGDLDAQSAWKNFGGLDLEQAYLKFCDNPLCYQEDFMFMGARAFQFYFPVVEKYFHEVKNDDDSVSGDSGDCQAWILGECLKTQLEQKELLADHPLLARINDLAAYVRGHLSQYSGSPADQAQINEVWLALENRLAEIRRPR
jgi:hypothetical protein